MDREKLLQDLKQQEEIVADSYDGSYELVREIVASYATLDDYSEVSFLDMNAIYLMAVGTWKINVEKKKEKIKLGCLPEAEKQRLYSIIDRIWDDACNSRYSYKADPKKPTVGMFGTGFYSFENKTTNECARSFVEMLVDISQESEINEETIFSKAEKVINGNFKGMKAASASVVLHCLMPSVFPVINGHVGSGNIYVALGINMDKPADISTYISNCRKIKSYRDSNLSFKNYRVIDLMEWELSKYETDEYIPSLLEYNPGITSDEYIEILQDESVVKKTSLDTIYLIYQMGGEASCKQLEDKYGESYAHYNSNAIVTAKAVQGYTNCKMSSRDEGGDRYWSILFQGREAKRGEAGTFIWKIRPELSVAISALEEAGFFEGLTINKEKVIFDHNTILYGPPGTGKTYNSVIYSVAIIEEKSLETVIDEAKSNYTAVKQRYDDYKTRGMIAFTTFHQSYGYEDFIEGIRPVLNGSDLLQGKSDIQYEIKDGIFKEFCDKAALSYEYDDAQSIGLNDNPVIWKVSLEGTGDNATRKDCLENNHIRIGWDSYGPEVGENTNYTDGGKYVLDAFINQMRIGDIVVSCYSSSETDAIGVIVGEYEWDDSYGNYKRLRKVKWLVKGIRENILKINNGSSFTLASIYRMKASLSDVLDIVGKYNDKKDESSKKRYVFVIDEINRGNISKIFGELITLIETTKRGGSSEAMKVKLPYSGKEFGVPENVYILGTMNTADRSIALMDTALRRRFSFIEMMPNPNILTNLGIATINDNGISLDVPRMLSVINKRIEFLFDREHTIGHAFFTGLKENPSLEKLGDVFTKNVIPLLQEYFYEDYEKIQLVLGDNKKSKDEYKFILKIEESASSIFNGNPELDAISTYKINPEAFSHLESYVEIYEKTGAEN